MQLMLQRRRSTIGHGLDDWGLSVLQQMSGGKLQVTAID